MYLNFLKKEGFLPKVDDVDNIIFKYERKTYVFDIDSNDKQFFRLIFPNLWVVENASDMTKALYVANDVNKGLKVGKIIIVRDRVWAIAEMFIDETPNLRDFLLRTLGVVKAAADKFLTEMNGKESDIMKHILS